MGGINFLSRCLKLSILHADSTMKMLRKMCPHLVPHFMHIQAVLVASSKLMPPKQGVIFSPPLPGRLPSVLLPGFQKGRDILYILYYRLLLAL
jgi:hypothetical protein